ncbi:hypothetical protein ACFL20_01485 [Spirochaetota bacterium]
MLKFLFVVLVIFLIYNFIKLVLHIFRNVKSNLEEERDQNYNEQSGVNFFEEEDDPGEKVIELDKDQYKVE